jgi:hypothetical protein
LIEKDIDSNHPCKRCQWIAKAKLHSFYGQFEEGGEENLRPERSTGLCIAGFEGRRHVVT